MYALPLQSKEIEAYQMLRDLMLAWPIRQKLKLIKK
jgi:hypothetical protein